MKGFIIRMLALAAVMVGFSAGLAAQQGAADAASAAPAEAADSAEQGAAPPSNNRGPRIYPQLAASLVERDVPVIDVRSAEEVEQTGMIDDAVNIPHTDLDALADFIGDDTDRAVVMYCGSGRRVSIAIEQLRERGFHGMVNAGGYQDLQQALEEPEE